MNLKTSSECKLAPKASI